MGNYLFIYMELEYFSGPSPKPPIIKSLDIVHQSLLRLWVIILGEAFVRVWPYLSFSFPTQWCVSSGQTFSTGLCKIPDHNLWEILMNIFFHISYHFAPI